MKKLLKELILHYRKRRRDFPWRETTDPYKILVSEVMLQQTQVSRVVPFYNKFIRRFPTPRVLAKAPLSEVLKHWQGLGYNRRAKFLHEAAKILSFPKTLRKGEMNTTPTPLRSVSGTQLTVEFLQSLPGVGPYTARAIAAFAYNKPEIFIETNIRTVFIHYYFTQQKNPRSDLGLNGTVSDVDLLPLVAQALEQSKMQPRDFYAALMDYGASLKGQGVRLNKKSKHYTKQSKFEGSARQKRAKALRKLLQNGASEDELIKLLK